MVAEPEPLDRARTQPELALQLVDQPQPWLVGVQLYRALGVIFLILYATGKLPALFAWPAGIGDIAIGLLAPIVGVAYARAPQNAATLVAGWNVFGILDLVIAVGTGFATAPSLRCSPNRSWPIARSRW